MSSATSFVPMSTLGTTSNVGAPVITTTTATVPQSNLPQTATVPVSTMTTPRSTLASPTVSSVPVSTMTTPRSTLVSPTAGVVPISTIKVLPTTFVPTSKMTTPQSTITASPVGVVPVSTIKVSPAAFVPTSKVTTPQSTITMSPTAVVPVSTMTTPVSSLPTSPATPTVTLPAGAVALPQMGALPIPAPTIGLNVAAIPTTVPETTATIEVVSEITIPTITPVKSIQPNIKLLPPIITPQNVGSVNLPSVKALSTRPKAIVTGVTKEEAAKPTTVGQRGALTQVNIDPVKLENSHGKARGPDTYSVADLKQIIKNINQAESTRHRVSGNKEALISIVQEYLKSKTAS